TPRPDEPALRGRLFFVSYPEPCRHGHGRARPDPPRLPPSKAVFKTWMLATGASMTSPGPRAAGLRRRRCRSVFGLFRLPGLPRQQAGLLRPLDQRLEDAAQGPRLLLGHVEPVQDVPQIGGHDRLLAGREEAAEIELALEIVEHRQDHLALGRWGGVVLA